MFEIVDDNGVIYSGSEDFIMKIWQDIQEDSSFLEWEGDLKLVRVIELYS